MINSFREAILNSISAPLLPALKIVAINLFLILILIAFLSTKTIPRKLIMISTGTGILTLVWFVAPMFTFGAALSCICFIALALIEAVLL